MSDPVRYACMAAAIATATLGGCGTADGGIPGPSEARPSTVAPDSTNGSDDPPPGGRTATRRSARASVVLPDAAPRPPDLASDARVIQRLASATAARASPFGDAAAVTRSGLYATPEEADRAFAARPGRALRIRVEAGSADPVALAVEIVRADQAAARLPDDVPVFVSGPDTRLAAAAVDRLADGGLGRVFLVGR